MTTARRRIDPAEIEICKREDGSEYLLGAGSFGEVHALPNFPSLKVLLIFGRKNLFLLLFREKF